MKLSALQRKPKWTTLALLPIMFFVLTSCGTKSMPADATTGFEFYVDPQTEQVTLLDASGKTLQTNSTPSDSRILVPDVDVALRDFGFEFRSPDKLIIRSAVENITDDLDFTQPFFFTLNSDSENFVRAYAPLVTD